MVELKGINFSYSLTIYSHPNSDFGFLNVHYSAHYPFKDNFIQLKGGLKK